MIDIKNHKYKLIHQDYFSIPMGNFDNILYNYYILSLVNMVHKYHFAP